MPWYKIELTNEQIKNRVATHIQDEFFRLFTEAMGPEDAAMFDSKDGTIIYFSPGATSFFIDVINQYMGVATERPSSTEIGLLVGHDKAWDILFR